MHFVDDARRGRDQGQVELALQTLLHDVQVQQAEKAAAVAEAQGRRRFRLEGQRGVVELQFAERFFQIGILVAVYGVEAAEDDGLGLPVAGQRLRRPVRGRGSACRRRGSRRRS